MDEKQMEEKLGKLRSSMEEMPSRTDKKAILSEIRSGKKKGKFSNGWIYVGSVACVLLLSLLLIQSGTFSFNKADDNGLPIPGEGEEALLLEYGFVNIGKEDISNFYPGFGSSNSELTIIQDSSKQNTEYEPIVLKYHLALKNIWKDMLGSIKGYDPIEESFENNIVVRIEPRETFIGVMDEVLGFNLFERPSSYIGSPVIPNVNGSVFSLSYELGVDINTDEYPPLPSVEDMDQLLEHAGEVDVIVSLKDKEIDRFYLQDEELHIPEVPREERVSIAYSNDNMDRGNHDFISDYHGEIVVDQSYGAGTLNRGDVIYFDTPKSQSNLSPPEKSISRIVGLPGETIEIINGYVFINGEQLQTPFNKALVRGLGKDDYFTKMDETNANYNKQEMNEYFSQNMEQTEIPHDSVFVLGDQWWRSVDSRMFGPLSIEEIDGKIIGYSE